MSYTSSSSSSSPTTSTTSSAFWSSTSSIPTWVYVVPVIGFILFICITTVLCCVVNKGRKARYYRVVAHRPSPYVPLAGPQRYYGPRDAELGAANNAGIYTSVAPNNTGEFVALGSYANTDRYASYGGSPNLYDPGRPLPAHPSHSRELERRTSAEDRFAEEDLPPYRK